MWLLFLYLGFMVIIFLGTWRAIRGYGPTFTLRKACISNLGNPEMNPKGLHWMNNTLIFLGISWGVLHVLAFPVLNQYSSPIAMSVLILGLLSSVSSILVAFIHEDRLVKVHFLFGGLFFLGFGIGMIIFLFFVLFRIVAGNAWPPMGLTVGIVIISILIGIILITTLVTRKGGRKEMNDLEWYLFFMIVIFHGFFFLLLSL